MQNARYHGYYFRTLFPAEFIQLCSGLQIHERACAQSSLSSNRRFVQHFQDSGAFGVHRRARPREWQVAPQVASDDQFAQSFTRSIEPSDWDRFLPYARRVRRLKYDEATTEKKVLSKEAIQEIAISRPSSAIFPNLQMARLYFETSRSTRLLLLLMHEQFTKLYLCTNAAGLKYVLRSIPKASPNLESLELDCIDMIQNTTSDLVAIVGELPHLREIILSSQLLSSVLVSSLAKHPRLTVLSQNSSDVEDSHWPDIHYHRRLFKGDFESLRLLQLDGNMDDLVHWLHNKDMLPSLRTFRVELRDFPSATKINECFVLLVEAFRNVTDLTFDMYKHNSSRPTSVPEVSIAIFEPLFEYEALTCFVFDHPDALSLCDRDMATMARAWPQLTSLSLGKSACYPESQALLTLGALVIFAQLSPRLQSLSLVINTIATPSRTPNGSEFSHEFKTLNLGWSHIDSAEAVGTFLSRILPAHTELQFCEDLSPFHPS